MTEVQQSPIPEPTDAIDQIKQLEAESAEHLAGWQRARADYQNLKREGEQRQGQLVNETKVALLADFLANYGRFRKALLDLEDQNSAWIAGVKQFIVQTDDLIARWGVEIINPANGETFNPEFHEAVQSEKDGTAIAAVLEYGYKLGNKLIQPAKVSVS